MSWIECVPNISEGRRRQVIDACAAAMRQTGIAILDVSADASHNRSVFTLAGDVHTLTNAVMALFDSAIASIDLRRHGGEHPRMGVVDVVPFVPIGRTSLDACVSLARAVAPVVAARHDLPVYLYEEAARSPNRRNLADIRRGGFEHLARRMAQPQWAPDFGPNTPHPWAGATAIGARRFLIAYNVNLATNRLQTATDIAGRIRERSGGLPAVKALGLRLADRGLVQVSMNLTDFRKTSILQAFSAVRDAAAVAGVAVVESELVGLAPAEALSASIASAVRLKDFSEDRILEHRLQAFGLV